MAKFKKAILKAGRDYHSPDGVVKVTTERLKHWADNFQKITAAGYAVPVAWDHASDEKGASPVKLSRKGELPSAEKTVGKLAAFNVAPDGQSAEILLDITDPKALGRVKRNEVCVSPIIFDKWLDGAKNAYSDLITHVDLVTWPVDNSQTPFVPVEPGTIACGIRMGLSRMAFPGDDEEDDKDADNIEEGKPGDTDPTAEAPEKPENPDMPKDEASDSIAEAIVAHLEQLGVSLPAAWTFKTDAAAEILLTGLKTALKAKQNAEPEKEEEEDEPNGDDVMQVQDPAFAAMSLKANAAHTFAEKQYRGGIAQRMSALLASGRCTPAEATAKEPEVKAIKLSLAADGEPKKSNLELWIESREAVPEGTFWSSEVRTQKLSLQAHEPPTGEASQADVDALIDRAFGKR